MGAIAELIFTLPIRFVAAIIFFFWFIAFGLLKISNLMPLKYDEWYKKNALKFTTLIRWE